MQIDLDEITPIPSSTPSSSRKRTRDPDSDVLDSLQQRLAESGTILKELSKAQQHPITARTAFVNYVKDSLLTMSKPKYKKARSSINSLLSELMDEDSDYDIPSAMEAPPIKRTQQASHSQPPLPQRPISAPPFCSFTSSTPSFSEHYQKPPYMSINEPPASSVWGSQSMEYMDQFHQPIVQHQHHHRTPTPLEQMMAPPQQLAQQPPQQTQQQQQQCTPTPAPVCDSLGSAAQVLREKPGPTHHVQSQPSSTTSRTFAFDPTSQDFNISRDLLMISVLRMRYSTKDHKRKRSIDSLVTVVVMTMLQKLKMNILVLFLVLF